MKRILSCLLFASAMLASCAVKPENQPDPDPQPEPEVKSKFEIANSTVYIPKSGTDVGLQFTVAADEDYYISCENTSTWAEFLGYDFVDHILYFGASENTGVEVRSCEMSLTCELESETLTRTVKVVQNAFDTDPITLERPSQTIDYKAQEVTFHATPAKKYEEYGVLVSSNQAWISQAWCDSEGMVHLKVSKNTGKASRKADVKITYMNHADATFALTQEGAPVPANVVDLGLPSGRYWADANIGASKASGAGYFYAWGETTPKSNFTKDTYTFSKTVTELPTDYDVATKVLGDGWRIPSRNDFLELVENCEMTYGTVDGVSGIRYTSKSNANSIFMPMTGFMEGTSLQQSGSIFLWSRNRVDNKADNAWAYAGEYGVESFDRYLGMPVRAVYTLK